MKQTTEPFLAWPGMRHIRLALILGIACAFWFAVLFGGAAHLCSLHCYRVRLHLDLDLQIPFVPQSVLAYLSIYPLMWMAPLILRKRKELVDYCSTLAIVTWISAVGFLIVPGECVFPPASEMAGWEWLVKGTKRIALEGFNYAPSLHIGLSISTVAIYSKRAQWKGRLLLWLWFGAIALSTMLLHQHYLVDVVTGAIVGLLTVQWFYRPPTD